MTRARSDAAAGRPAGDVAGRRRQAARRRGTASVGVRRRPMVSRLDRDHYAPYFLTVIANVVSTSASQVYLRRYGIGVNDWRVISHLGLAPGSTAQVVSNVLQVDKSVVSRSVKTLVDRGLVAVESTPGFRRLYLTAGGAALHKEMLPVVLQRERILLAGLTPEEVDQLLGLLRRLLVNLPALAAYDPPPTGTSAGTAAEDDGAVTPSL